MPPLVVDVILTLTVPACLRAVCTDGRAGAALAGRRACAAGADRGICWSLRRTPARLPWASSPAAGATRR